MDERRANLYPVLLIEQEVDVEELEGVPQRRGRHRSALLGIPRRD